MTPVAERHAALASGVIAALLGVRHRSIPGLLIAGAGGALIYHGLTGRGFFGKSLGADATGGQAGTEQRLNRGVHVAQAFTIDKPPDELYQFWRNFENLPRIMTHLESVQVQDGGGRRSHWVARAPSIAGGKVEWDAEMTEDMPNHWIAWRSLPGADVDNAGEVRFEQSPRGTIVRVDMRYVAPAGRLGGWIAKLFGEGPERQIRENLRNFKQLMETGEVPTVDGQPRGTCLGHGTRDRWRG